VFTSFTFLFETFLAAYGTKALVESHQDVLFRDGRPGLGCSTLPQLSYPIVLVKVAERFSREIFFFAFGLDSQIYSATNSVGFGCQVE
jgi:hypothetical protein